MYNKVRSYVSSHWRLLIVVALGLLVCLGLLLYKLGSLVDGLSSGEVAVLSTPLGWHGIYNHPLYLPLTILRSIIFTVTSHHGQTVARLANSMFGLFSIVTFAFVVRSWHDRRTTVLAVALFATSSWTLHASRLASYDVLYLSAVAILMLGYMLRQRHPQSAGVFYGTALSWSYLLFIPGLIWLVLLTIILSWSDISDSWRAQKAWWHRLVFGLAGLVWLPLLLPDFLRTHRDLWLWLGLPTKLPQVTLYAKQLLAVPLHLLIRGPAYPDIWLGRLPILDAATLTFTIVGGYFYYRHWRARRARKLALILLSGAVLIALGGPVGLSLLVPVLFLVAAAGIHSLLKSWLRVFPHNPIARNLGIGLIVIAVSVSCIYNLRSYFIAWPHNTTTQTVFRYQR